MNEERSVMEVGALTGMEGVPASSLPSQAARARLLSVKFEPLFTADWERALMLHYEIAPELLQPFVPFELDVRNGKAYVSLVAFTMRGLCPTRGGWVTAIPFMPIATHEFLNVRTYVKHGGEPGIFFLAEWLPNALSVLLGRPVFGLPYRLGTLKYEHDHESGELGGSVRSWCGRGVLQYRARTRKSFAPCEEGSLTEFLMERYTAFTEWHGWKRRFRIWHKPWQQRAVNAEVSENTLISLTGDWAYSARFIGANYSPGALGVWMGRPMMPENFRWPIPLAKASRLRSCLGSGRDALTTDFAGIQPSNRNQ